MVQCPQGPCEVEGAVPEWELGRVPLEEGDVLEAFRALACLLEKLRDEVDPDDLADVRRERERQCARTGARVERALVPGRRDEADHVPLERGRARVLKLRDPLSRPREPLARCIFERLLPGRDRTRRLLFRDLLEQASDLGAGWKAELVSPEQRLGGLVAAGPLDRARKLRRADVGERVERPGLGQPPEAMDRARIRLGPDRAQQSLRVAPELVRDREPAQPFAEGSHEPVVGRIDPFEPVGQLAAEWIEQPELVQPPVAACREPAELGQDPLTCRSRYQGRVRADERLRRLVEADVQLVLEPDRPQQPQRIVLEDGPAHRAQSPRSEIVTPAEWVDRLPTGERSRDRVDGEVTSRQIVLDGARKRREVDGATAVQRHPPGAVSLRERERRTARALRVRARGSLRLAHGDVEVDELAPEQLVAHGAADDPRFLSREHFLGGATHRRSPFAHGADPR